MMTYRQALSQPMLTAVDELEMIDAWRTNQDVAARDRLISTHMRLCFSVASRYDSNEEHIKDLAQDGVFGLMRAIEMFNPLLGTRFATYARWWVMTAVSQSIGKVSTVVDMPPRTFLEARGGGFEDEQIGWAARQAARGEVPLDAPVGDDGETAVVDLLKDVRPTPEASVIETDRLSMFKRSVADGMLKAMTPREAEVLRRRSLVDTPDTLEQIATDLGVSRERVRQIETSATEKLRKFLVNGNFQKSLLRS